MGVKIPTHHDKQVPLLRNYGNNRGIFKKEKGPPKGGPGEKGDPIYKPGRRLPFRRGKG